MKKSSNSRLQILVCLVTAFAIAPCLPASEPDLHEITGGAEMATEDHIVWYSALLNEVPYSSIRGESLGTVSVAKMRENKLVKKDLATLKAHFKKAPPYSTQEAADILSGKIPEGAVFQEASGYTLSPPRRQPFLVRETAEDLGPADKAKPAAFSFLNDNTGLKEQERWAAKGAFILPFRTYRENPDAGARDVEFRENWFGPAIAWNVVDTNALEPDEVEELQFSLPWKHTMGISSGSLSVLEFTTVPYYHTDFGFDGATVGASVKVEPTITFTDRFGLGQYINLFGEDKGPSFMQTLAYRLRVAPKIAYDRVTVGGDHTKRAKGDEWLRLGAALELGITPFGKDAPLEFVTSYEFFEGLSGDEAWSDLFTAGAIYWLNEKRFGISMKYQSGETPVSTKAVDSLTLGIEIKH